MTAKDSHFAFTVPIGLFDQKYVAFTTIGNKVSRQYSYEENVAVIRAAIEGRRAQIVAQSSPAIPIATRS